MDKGVKHGQDTTLLSNKLRTGGTVVILSEDRVQRERWIAELVARYDEPKGCELRSAKAMSGKQLKNEIASPSLFSPFTITILKDLHECSADLLREFLTVLEGPIQGNLLIFSGEKLQANSVFLKKAQSLDIVVQLPKLTGDTLEGWAMTEFQERNLTIERESLSLLLSAAEGSADALAPMIEKLDLYLAGLSQAVKPEHIKLLFTIPAEAHEFELAEAIIARDIVRIELLISTLISSGKSPFTIIPLLARTFANYAVIALALRRNTAPQEVRDRLNISSWVYNRYLPTAKRYPPRAFTSHARALLSADSKIKNRSLGPEAILSELLHSLAILA